MVTVKVKLVNNNVEVFTTESYVVGLKKDLHPDILSVDVYAGSKKVYHMQRHFHWFYKKFLYKPIQKEIKADTAQEQEIIK